MFAAATFTSQKSEMRLVVPPSALLRLHDKDWVFRSEGPNRYRRLEVRAASTAPDGQQFIYGALNPGDHIVVNALQFMSAIEPR
jgi:hypothetical protein